MRYVHYDDDGEEHVYEVDYHYDPPEKGSRWHPPSPGMIDYMKVTENGIDKTDTLSCEALERIEKACLADWNERLDYDECC